MAGTPPLNVMSNPRKDAGPYRNCKSASGQTLPHANGNSTERVILRSYILKLNPRKENYTDRRLSPQKLQSDTERNRKQMRRKIKCIPHRAFFLSANCHQ